MPEEAFQPNDARRFLNGLYEKQTSGFLELRYIDDSSAETAFHAFPLDLDNLFEEIAAHAGDKHIFFGVNPRGDPEEASSHDVPPGSEQNLRSLVGFWADVDGKDFPGGKDDALNEIHRFDAEPTFIVDSGNGFHAYFVLDEPREIGPKLETQTPFDDHRLKRLSRRIHAAMRGDATHSLDHILRLPGTPNIKDPNDPTGNRTTSRSELWKPCKVRTYNQIRHTVQQLDSVTPDVRPEHEDLESIQPEEPDRIETLDDLESHVDSSLLQRARELPQEHGDDRSQNDFYIACQLYERGFSDGDVYQAFKLFADHGWAAGEKYRERGEAYLLDYTLPAARREVNQLDVLLEKITEDPSNTRLIERALDLVRPLGALKKEIAIDRLNDAVGSTITKKTLRRQANEGTAFQPAEFAKTLIERHHFLCTLDTMYHYELGVYEPDGEPMVRQAVADHLDDSAWTSKKCDEVVQYIKDKRHIDHRDMGHKDHWINCKNGMVNVRTGEHFEHSPKYRSLCQFNVEYDPEADADVVDQFVDDVFPKGTHDLIWEHIGYIFASDLELKKFLILHGSGENGKSVWLDLVAEICGRDNVSHESLNKLASNDFALVSLFGKVANTYADLGEKAIERTDLLKQLTGGDEVAGEIKHRQGRVKFRNKAHLLFSANELPPVHDHNDAFFNRAHIVPCPNTFTGEDKDPKIKDKLLTEKAKATWLNRAIAGAQRLYENQQFTVPRLVEKHVMRYRFRSDSVTEFIQTCMAKNPGDFEFKETVYQTYNQWCKSHGRSPVSSQKFSQRAKKAPNEWDEGRETIAGTQRAVWYDVQVGDLTRKRMGVTEIAVSDG